MNKTLEWNVNGNSYTLTFPSKVKNIKQIEINRQILSSSQFDSISKSPFKESQGVADMIEIEATLSVIAPKEFWSDLNVESFGDLDIEPYNAIKEAYIEQIAPWMNNIKKELKLF